MSTESPPRITDLLPAQELRALTRKSNLAGALAILGNWALVFAALAVLARWPHPLSFVLVVVFLGGRQLGFAVLAHEAAHRTLFRSRWANQHLADWLCARAVWSDVARYRQHHLRHHAHTGQAGDPDLSLVEPFPTSRGSLRRKLLRDICGISGLRRIIGLLAMDLGILEYSVAADPQRRPRAGRGVLDYAREGLRHLTPVVIANLALYLALAAAGIGWTYSAWVLAYLTSFSLFLRIRSIAEHACTAASDNPFRNTRTTRAGWLARLTVAPFSVNYHLEHHLMASVPFFRLPQLHRQLQAHGLVQPARNYSEVLRLAASG